MKVLIILGVWIIASLVAAVFWWALISINKTEMPGIDEVEP